MTQGVIFNIQRFSTHDGPGIRTVVFLKGCPLRCFWCQNPESQSTAPVLMHRRELCLGCGSCASACERGAAFVEAGACYIDRKKCVGCGKCAERCPAEALSVSGRTASVRELMGEILKDRAYYLNSGGGVTLSGGEASLQADFAVELLSECKKRYLNTALETCGFASQGIIERFIPLTDIFLYDIKTVDEEKHRLGTGQDNKLIKSNAKLLADAGCRMVIRMPLIPGYNDGKQDVLQLRKFVEEKLRLPADSIELLKYNALGEVKFERLGMAGGPHMSAQSEEYFEELKNLLC